MPEDPNLIVFPFDGGLNTQADDEDVPLGDCVDCLNVIADKPGALRKRPGRIAAGGYTMTDDYEPSVIRRWTPDNGTTYDWVGFFELAGSAKICEDLDTPMVVLKTYSSDLPTDVDIDFVLGALRFAPNNLVHPPQWYGNIDRQFCWLEWINKFNFDANYFLEAPLSWDDFDLTTTQPWILSAASTGAPAVAGNKVGGTTYYYRFSLVYDGQQEGPLTDWYLSVAPEDDSSYNYFSLYFTDAVNLTSWNQRLTGINVYRSDHASGDYTKITSVSCLSEKKDASVVFEDASTLRGVFNAWHIYTGDYNGGAGGYYNAATGEGIHSATSSRTHFSVGDHIYYADQTIQITESPFVYMGPIGGGVGESFDEGDFVWGQYFPVFTCYGGDETIYARSHSFENSLLTPEYTATGDSSGADPLAAAGGVLTRMSMYDDTDVIDSTFLSGMHGGYCCKMTATGGGFAGIEWANIWDLSPLGDGGTGYYLRVHFRYKVICEDEVWIRTYLEETGAAFGSPNSTTVATKDEWIDYVDDATYGIGLRISITPDTTIPIDFKVTFDPQSTGDITVYIDNILVWFQFSGASTDDYNHQLGPGWGGDRVATHLDWGLGPPDSKKDWLYLCGSNGNDGIYNISNFIEKNSEKSIFLQTDYLRDSYRTAHASNDHGVGYDKEGFINQSYLWTHETAASNDVRLMFYDVALAAGVEHPFGPKAKLVTHYKCSTWLNGRLFVGNVRLDPSEEAEDHPDWIVFSAFNSPDVLPIVNYIEVPELLGSEIIDLTVHLGELIVLTNRGVYRLHVPAGDPTAWDMVEAHPTANLVAFRASAVAENEFFFFAGVEAVYALTPNFEFIKLTNPIRDDYQAITTKADTQMHYDSKRGLLYCWFGEAAAEIKVFDVNAFRDGGRKVWRPWKLPHATITETKVLFAGDEDFETHIINFGTV